MSRKRSEAAIRAYTERFVEGAQSTHPDVDEATAHRVYEMIVGFSGFGFPKGHGAAFGLLAYQSAWLRVHYGPEFVCSLLDEQPMGFYPSDALVHEAQRRGIEVLRRRHQRELRRLHRHAGGRHPDRAGLRAGRAGGGGRRHRRRPRAGGPYRSVEDLASRSGIGRPTLERLAWSGACDGLVDGDRRVALWQLGVTAPGYGSGDGATQLSLPLDLPGAPSLEPLTGWPAMVADYATTGLTTGVHPMGLLRDDLEGRGAVHSADLRELRHGQRVRIGGVVVARQRPGTAKGVVFMLLEDEHGTINLVVPPETYERERLVVRSEPLVIAQGMPRAPPGGGRRDQRPRTRHPRARRARPSAGPDRGARRAHHAAGLLAARRRGARAAGHRRGGDRPTPPAPRGSGRSRRPCSRSPTAVGGEAPHRRQVGYSPRVLALGFVALFLVIGLAVFFVAFRGGPSAPVTSQADRKRRIGRPVLLAIAVVFIGFGLVIPLLSLLHNGNTQADAAIGGVELTSSEEHGRQVFKERCATCHTLEDAGAVGMVGPNLDDLRPATALTLDAINKGRARGQGQMPAQLVSGPDAQDVAKYVATVSGR